MNHFLSLHSYENFIYNLANHYTSVVSSTLVVVRRSAKQAMIAGEILFANAYRLTISELVDFADDPFLIRRYGYEAWHGKEKLYWYDSQPHPNTPDLALNHPHHKHVPPDIKHNRALKGTRSTGVEFYATQLTVSNPRDGYDDQVRMWER